MTMATSNIPTEGSNNASNIHAIAEVAPKLETDNEEQFPQDDPALRSAIHGIMSNGSASPVKKDPITQEVAWRGDDELQSYEQWKTSKRQTQYFDNAFAVRDQPTAARERLTKTSVLTAEIKTNVIIQDEFKFLTATSVFLAARYNRPESSIVVTLDHSVCMVFGGTFEPAYLLTVSAVADQVKPTLNRRNTILIQRFLGEELAVSSNRGIIKFIAIPEENLGTCGITLAAEIGKDTRTTVGSHGGSLKRLSTVKRRMSTKAVAKTLPTPPVSPGAGQALNFDFPAQQVHSRSVSEATTSSNPEIDLLRTNRVQWAPEKVTSVVKAVSSPKPVTSRSSRFFRRLRS